MPNDVSGRIGRDSPASPKLQPFALKDAPALIEAVFPAQKVSFEAQRERKANLGQTLTGLGSYWKGRKPLILVRMTAAECAFGYRDSLFKHALAGQRLILSVRLALPKRWRPVAGYADVAWELKEQGVARPDARAIFDAVVAIRRRKLPDPALIGNAGSFFKNPIVSYEEHQALIERHPSLVGYPQPDGSFKLAAGWLIEAVGLKGVTRGRAGAYEKQALVLVNRGGATGAEILALAREVQEKVTEAFGVRLEPEPVIV